MSERKLGYAIELENKDSLLLNGIKPRTLFKSFQDNFPAWNPKADPSPLVNIVDQGQVGSCQGQSLAKCFQICFYLATGRVLNFSAMCGYIIAQQYDGIRGDQGSTLSGGQKVATVHGMCLEKFWPYTGQYDRRIKTDRFPFMLKSAQPTNDPDEIREALALGLPVQTGVAWNRQLDQEVVTAYDGRNNQGGHSTLLWQGKNINSWGTAWCQDGMSDWSSALDDIVTWPGNTFVIYAPDEMSMPDLQPIKTYGV